MLGKCITVKNNGTQHGIYIILELHQKFIIQIHFILSITKQLQKFTHGNRNLARLCVTSNYPLKSILNDKSVDSIPGIL